MDIILKYTEYSIEKSSGKTNYFASIKEVKEYFLNLHDKDGNNNYFFFNREREYENGEIKTLRRFDAKDGNKNIVNENDNIYFLFEGKVVAKAKYVRMKNPEREDKFVNGYKVKNVLIRGCPKKLKYDLFNNENSLYYIKDEDKKLKKELKKLFK